MDSDVLEQKADPTPPPARRRGPTVALYVVALLLLAAAGGWLYNRFIYYPSTPQYALAQFLDAARARDYDKVYHLVKIPDSLRPLVPNAAELRKWAETFPGIIPELRDYHFGDIKIDGDRATIETTALTRESRNGTTTSLTLPMTMVRTGEIWRVDGQSFLEQIQKRGLDALLHPKSP